MKKAIIFHYLILIISGILVAIAASSCRGSTTKKLNNQNTVIQEGKTVNSGIEIDSSNDNSTKLLLSNSDLKKEGLLSLYEYSKVAKLTSTESHLEGERLGLLKKGTNFDVAIHYMEGSDADFYYLITIIDGEYSYETDNGLRVLNITPYVGVPGLEDTLYEEREVSVYDDLTIHLKTRKVDELEKTDTTFDIKYKVNNNGYFIVERDQNLSME